MTDQSAAVKFGLNFTTSKKYVFVVNNDRFFLTHRASWATALVASGGHVTVIAQDTGHADNIRRLGFDYISLHFGRESISAKEAITSASKLFAKLLRLRPDVVFLIATAAYSLGWPAALFLPKTKFIRVITGAGRALTADVGSSRASAVVRSGLGFSGQLPNVSTLFQLETDKASFISAKLAVAKRSVVIAGTGLDTDTWTPADEREESVPVVLFAARLFREKGIYEFIDVARAFPTGRARFVVVGRPDSGVSSSVTDEELASWQAEGLIEYQGESNDMLKTYRGADILLLPSTHPEGTPRSLIEAASCGVVAVASDQAGCKAVVVHGETGLIANVNEKGNFASALDSLLSDPHYLAKLSRGARLRASEKFSLPATLRAVYETVGI
jgi:glycosyltransferase involved in cell wall biosynthesis